MVRYLIHHVVKLQIKKKQDFIWSISTEMYVVFKERLKQNYYAMYYDTTT